MSFVTTGQGRGQAFVQAVLSQDSASLAAQEAEIVRRVRNEVSRLRAQAQAEASREAQAEAATQLAVETAALHSARDALTAACAELAAPLAGKEAELAELVTDLAFRLTCHITGTQAATDPAALQTLVTKLLTEAAAERAPQQSLRLRLHPTDHAYLAPLIPPETATLHADPGLTPGSALLEFQSPDNDPAPEWNASLPARLATLQTALGLPGDASSA
jgi:flagellar assembly protein FliH